MFGIWWTQRRNYWMWVSMQFMSDLPMGLDYSGWFVVPMDLVWMVWVTNGSIQLSKRQVCVQWLNKSGDWKCSEISEC